jgi:hypothetical protein
VVLEERVRRPVYIKEGGCRKSEETKKKGLLAEVECGWIA